MPQGELSEAETERILAFLDGAPPEVEDWAQRQAALLRARPAAAPPAPEPELDDEPGPDAEAAPAAAGSSARRVFTTRFVILVALLAGIAGGIWYAAQPGGQAGGTPTTGTQTAGVDTAARMAELEAKVAADPSDIEARLELGVLYFNRAETERAREQWQAILDLDPNNVNAWYNLGFYYLTIDPADTEAGRRAWEKVVELAPDSETAKTVRSHLDGLIDPTATPSPGGSETPG